MELDLNRKIDRQTYKEIDAHAFLTGWAPGLVPGLSGVDTGPQSGNIKIETK